LRIVFTHNHHPSTRKTTAAQGAADERAFAGLVREWTTRNGKAPREQDFCEYRYRDSDPGFHRERALSSPVASGNVRRLQGKLLNSPIDTAAKCTSDVCCECAERSDVDGVSALVTTTGCEELGCVAGSGLASR
jgi:hypothetical protein